MLGPIGNPLGTMLTEPMVPQKMTMAPQAAAPDPEKKNMWQNFMAKLESDPNLRMALLQTGLGLLQDPKMGQTGIDQFSRAVQTGVGTFGELNQRDRDQKITEDDRQFQRNTTNRQLDQGDERIDIAETQANTQAENAEVRNRTAAERLQIAKDQLAETKRSNLANEEIRGRDNASGAQLTGTERILGSFQDALISVNPEMYQGEEGKAQALLDAQQWMKSSSDPEGQMRGVVQIATILEKGNIMRDDEDKLSPDEIFSTAQELYQSGLDRFKRSDAGTNPSGEVSDDLNGQTIETNAGTGTLVKVEGGYKVVVDGKPSKVYSEETIRKLQERN